VFSRGSDAGSSQPLHVASAAPGDNPSRSFIAPGLQVTGNLVSQGDLVIEGQVNGDIKGSHVVVGENATITGSIVADDDRCARSGHGIAPRQARRGCKPAAAWKATFFIQLFPYSRGRISRASPGAATIRPRRRT